MKKLLIGILALLLVTFGALAVVKGISIGNLKIESIKDIKSKSQTLDQELQKANDSTKKTYPEEIQKLNSSIKSFNLAKDQYKNKTDGIENVQEIGVTQIKTYKVEFLWTKIGNYATKEGCTLTMNIKNGKDADTYNLEFILIGSYISITDFIYDIENDEDLKFQIKDFRMTTLAKAKEEAKNINNNKTNNTTNTANTANTTNTTNTANTANTTNTNKEKSKNNKDNTPDERILHATFTVENVGIQLN